MENERFSKVWLGYIPDELWPNILSRLPAKSLVQFRCVSTTWLSLINDADFRRLHLNNNRHGKDLLVVQGPQKSCVLRSSITFNQTTDAFFTLGLRDDIDPDNDEYIYEYDDDGWSVECCIDGLILMSKNDEDVLELWNPAVSKCIEFVRFPYIQIDYTEQLEATQNVEIGFAYDASLKDYKHIRLIYFIMEPSLHAVAIYTVGAASWKIVQSNDKGFPDRDMVVKDSKDRPVYLRGSFYFIGLDEDYRDNLISIDVSSEKFCRTSFPEGVCSEGQLVLVDEECSLAFFETKFKGMWVWGSCGGESEYMCWTKRYSLNLSVPNCLHVNRNNEMLIKWWHEKLSFKLASEKEVKQKWDLVSSYNLQTQDEKILQHYLVEDGRGHDNIIHAVFGYVESLILL